MPSNRLSQADSFLEDLFTDVRTDRVFSNYIDFATKQIFEVLLDRDDVEKTSPRFQLDQDINVAFLGSLAARNRAKDAKIFCPVSGGNPQNVVPLI